MGHGPRCALAAFTLGAPVSEASAFIEVPVQPESQQPHCPCRHLKGPWLSSGLGRERQAHRLIVGTLIYLSGAQFLFELHVNAAARGIDSNPALCGGNADYHTGLI